MDSCRPLILRTYAAWTALSALRSGAPIKSRGDVYPLLATVAFDQVLEGTAAIAASEFDVWHRTAALGLCKREPRLNVGWAAKLLNVYLKTAAYAGGMGRPGLAPALHPPIDTGLWGGLRRRFGDRPDIIANTHAVQRIKDIRDYETYSHIIDGCRDAATVLNCMLIEVEQLWEGSIAPAV